MRKTTGSPTRDEIVAASLQLFALRGFDATTITDIAEYLEADPAGVKHLFPTKDALLRDILRPTLQEIDHVLTRYDASAPDADPGTLIEDLIDAIAGSGPQVAALLDDPAAGALVYSSATDSALTARIEMALARRLDHALPQGCKSTATRRTALRMRAACAVAAIPAGIAAWQEANPAVPVIDVEARTTLTDIVRAIVTPGSRHDDAP